MRELAGNDVLAGSLSGKALLPKLVAAISSEVGEPTPLFMDFAGVTVATGSFLRETVLPLRDFARSQRTNHYPVVANPNPTVLDELSLVLELRGDAFIVCEVGARDVVTGWRVVGVLDERQQLTLGLVRELGEADASELMLKRKDIEEVGQTAWNNRLSNLASMSLLVERSVGRQKKYSPVMERA